MIEARGLTKRYGSRTAVDDLTFTVRPGIVTGFLGPNGAGKSTTMRMALGLDAPTRGSVTVNGKPYREHAAPLHEVGALLEARSVHTGRSAYHHLLALAQTAGIARTRVEEVIELVGCTTWPASGRAASPSGWANASASPPHCSATRAPSSWTSRSTAWIPRASAGSGTCSRASPTRAARYSSPRT